MRYIDALKKYNEGKDKWCSPKKGTPDYLQIINMMKKKSDIKCLGGTLFLTSLDNKNRMGLINHILNIHQNINNQNMKN